MLGGRTWGLCKVMRSFGVVGYWRFRDDILYLADNYGPQGGRGFGSRCLKLSTPFKIK